MGPKNVPATRAGALPLRDISWIDRMYMKFETMCVEVDKNPSLLLQETSKFVESQVNAVGTNVKKLCTELIQDLLSPESGNKKLECALHCKCNCLDSEKSQPIEEGKGVSTKEESFANGDVTCNVNIDEQKHVTKNEGSKLETSNIVKDKTTKTEMPQMDAAGELHRHRSSEELCLKSSTNHDQGGIQDELKVMADIGQLNREDIDGNSNCEEKIDIVKGLESCTVKAEEVDANPKIDGIGTHKMPLEGSMKGVIEATLCRSEAVFTELASTPTSNNEVVATDVNGGATSLLGSQKYASYLIDQEDKRYEHLGGMQEREINCHCMLPASNGDAQQVLDSEMGLYLKTYDDNAICKYGLNFYTKCLPAKEVIDTNRVDGSLESLRTDDFKTEESRKMSELLTKDDAYEEEQSAHWFVGEELRKEFQSEIFNAENSRYGDSLVNEFDSDWEML